MLLLARLLVCVGVLAVGRASTVSYTIDSGANTARFTSACLVDGLPAVSYFSTSASDVVYVRATSADGSSWGTPTDIDTRSGAKTYLSMSTIGGEPAVVYTLTTGTIGLYFKLADDTSFLGARGTTPATSANSVAVVTGTEPQYNSLLEVNGRPAVSWYDSTSALDLKFSRATDASGTAWTTVTVASAGDTGKYTTLLISNGNPAIVFYDTSDTSLRFVRASDVNGASWPTSTVRVDGATTSVGTYASGALVNGYPAATYVDSTNGDLRFAVAADIDGSTWRSPVVSAAPLCLHVFRSPFVCARCCA
jgi:hypothetical protein